MGVPLYHLFASGAGESPSAKVPATRQVAAWFLCRTQDLDAKPQAFLTALRQQCPALQNAYDLAQQFLGMVRKRNKEALPAWMQAATDSGSTVLARFAASLKQDLAAVEAGLSLQWSNGQTEGQVNRLKLVKRSMYGRAKFDLLRARVLPRVQAA